MNLLNDLYIIEKSEFNANQFLFSIILNSEHFIFKSHFPGYPVTPAVVQIAIIQELYEEATKEKISLDKIGVSKFLKIINPEVDNQLNVNIEFSKENNLLQLKSSIFNQRGDFLKMNSTYNL